MTGNYVLVPFGDTGITVAMEVTEPAAPAPSPPTDASDQVAAENVRRLPDLHPLSPDDVKGHAA